MNETHSDITPLGILLNAQRDMHGELKEHRILFSDLKDCIADQKTQYSALGTAIDNLTASIDRHEHIVEKVVAIESWKANSRLEERVATLELWHMNHELTGANWKGRFFILAALGTAVTSALLYVADTILSKYMQGLGP